MEKVFDALRKGFTPNKDGFSFETRTGQKPDVTFVQIKDFNPDGDTVNVAARIRVHGNHNLNGPATTAEKSVIYNGVNLNQLVKAASKFIK